MVMVIYYLASLFVAQFTLAQNISDVKNLKNYLFNVNAYDFAVRPAVNQTEATKIDVDLYLSSIISLESVTQQLTTSGFLKVTWTDSELKWNPVNFGGIQELYLPQDLVWKPKLTLRNGFQKLSELGSSFLQVQVKHNGDVVWEPFEVFQTKCPVDIQYYPFDTQTCAIEFVVWSTPISQVFLKSGAMGLTTFDFDPNAEWNIKSMSFAYENENNQSVLLFNLEIKRKPMFFVLNLLLPIILLAFLSNCTFILPGDCGEKISYAITVFLAFGVFLTIISASLPANSQTTSLISIYLIFHLFQGTLIIICAGIQIRMLAWQGKKRVPRILKFFVIKCLRARCRSRPNIVPSSSQKLADKTGRSEEDDRSKEEVTKEKDNDNDIVSWQEVSYAFDLVFFVFFVVTLLISTIVLLSVDTNK